MKKGKDDIMEELLKLKDMLRNDDTLYLETTNKSNGWIGCASFYTNGEQKIWINEGNGDGSDDHGVSYEDFLKYYMFELKKETF